MLRSLFAKLTGFIASRSHAARRKSAFPVRIWFEPLNLKGIRKSSSDGVFLSGETIDLSSTGVAFSVSVIRVKENYLVGQERVLNAELDLPDGRVRMQLIGRRYESIGVHVSTERYLVGAEIVNISKDDRELYDHFLRYGGNRKKAVSPSLEMGGN